MFGPLYLSVQPKVEDTKQKEGDDIGTPEGKYTLDYKLRRIVLFGPLLRLRLFIWPAYGDSAEHYDASPSYVVYFISMTCRHRLIMMARYNRNLRFALASDAALMQSIATGQICCIAWLSNAARPALARKRIWDMVVMSHYTD